MNSPFPSSSSGPLPLAASRARRLRHGINLSHWYSQVYVEPGYVPAHFDSYIRTRDIALIRDMGFDHVRFAIACEPIMEASVGGRLPDDGTVAAFIAFWEALASALAGFDPDLTFFEILNEPCIHDADRWNRIQNTAAAAIRRIAPHHTIIISGDQWSQLPELLKLTPPDDRNLIANFHLYDPTAFTHQGAGWSPPWAMFTKGLTYPADPRFVAEFLTTVTDRDARRQLAEYVEVNWNARAYHDFIQPAVAWGRAHGLCLTCNEFGTYKVFSPRASRLNWVRDVSAALSANGIGWTMWDYAGDFAVVTKKDGVRVPDRELLQALQLAS